MATALLPDGAGQEVGQKMYNYSWKEAGPGDLCMLMTMVSNDEYFCKWGQIFMNMTTI